MQSRPTRFLEEVLEFRRRLDRLRSTLRDEASLGGGLLANFEIGLINLTLLRMRLATLVLKILIEPAALCRRLFHRLRPRGQTAIRAAHASAPIVGSSEQAPSTSQEQSLLVANQGLSPSLARIAAGRERYPRKTFSALLCNYNHGKYIDRAIQAVVSQSRPPDEYLILDDGSTDNSVEIISRYAARYPYIRLIRKPKNEGGIKGINHLTEMATGDYIHWGASDDYMLPGFIEYTMLLAEAFPNAGIVSGQMASHAEDSDSVQITGIANWESGYVTPRKYLFDYLEVSDAACTLSASTIFRRATVEEMGGWRKELGIWCVSFVLQASALKYGMCYLDMPIYTWVWRKQGWTYRANQDLAASVEVNKNYLALMRSSPFRALFSENFARNWFRRNMELAANTFTHETCERILSESRAAA